MSTTQRQSNILAVEDWKKVYQTFREADFTSYDFETIRKSMIDYLRTYYPEDFNDYIESSEFVALIDLIAFLGQSLAFRADLNARENFLDTAERRDSILKLAKLVSYVPKRNIPSSGFLKIESLTTTENIFDSNGINLSNLNIVWNDVSNENWLEQFTTIINAALVSSQIVGKPGNSQTLNGVLTEEYAINIVPNTLPIYQFNSQISGVDTSFEVVSATSINQNYVYEADPRPNRTFNILRRNDNFGNNSANTGFFLFFKQGTLGNLDFNLPESLPNRIVSIDVNGINNTDVWLYQLTSNNEISELWKKVPAVNGINVIYNKQSDRNLYQVNSRVNDQIDLVFGDGSFANVPQGPFRLYYRTSSGQNNKITADEMQGIVVPIPYISRSGREETIMFRVSLQYTVSNSSPRESLEAIRQRAPQFFYTQNRMVTGEDYNIIPFTAFNNVLKVKAINRTSSGVSRYLDVLDVTGKYSSTNIFAQDGYLYREVGAANQQFSYISKAEIYKNIYDQVNVLLNTKELIHFYYNFYPKQVISTNPEEYGKWKLSSVGSNECTGYFLNELGVIKQIGTIVSSNYKYLRPGALIKFKAPGGYYFDAQDNFREGTPVLNGEKNFLYASINEVLGDGTNGGFGELPNGTGPVILNRKVPDGAIIDSIIPVFKNDLPDAVIDVMVEWIELGLNFGLRYDQAALTWVLIDSVNINDDVSDMNNPPFSNDEPVPNTNSDDRWLIRFTRNINDYTVGNRILNYVFESAAETRFYFDERVKVYDSKTGTTIQDQIKILKINQQPDSAEAQGTDYVWYIYKNIIESDGYSNNRKIYVTFPDTNFDNIPDNPDLFDMIVAPGVNPNKKYVFFKADYSSSFVDYLPIDNTTVVTDYATQDDILLELKLYPVGQLFYAYEDKKFFSMVKNNNVLSLVQERDYIAKVGRQMLLFHYRHNSPNYRRIDPSPNNIIDLYFLTTSYERDYRAWLEDTSGTVPKPTQPTSEELKTEFSRLENLKAVSDTIIYNSAVFKPLFGNKAAPSLQATFKVIKNPNIDVSDNEIKTSVVAAINRYFDIDNWDFGETFYFSELSAYLHNSLTPNVSSIIIVPVNTNESFGTLYQINSEPNEILVSAATVENVEIIDAITALQINRNLQGVNTNKIL